MRCEAERSSKDIATRPADDKAPSLTCPDAVAASAIPPVVSPSLEVLGLGPFWHRLTLLTPMFVHRRCHHCLYSVHKHWCHAHDGGGRLHDFRPMN